MAKSDIFQKKKKREKKRTPGKEIGQYAPERRICKLF